MATPTNCILDNAMSALITAINGMDTNNYFFNYKCADLDETFDFNKLSMSDRTSIFYCELFPDEEAIQLQQTGGIFKDSTPIGIVVYTVSTVNNFKSVLNKVDQDFKKLFGTTHFKISCPDISHIERVSFLRNYTKNNNRYGCGIVNINLITMQSTDDPEERA